jgi:hypothetical protein
MRNRALQLLLIFLLVSVSAAFAQEVPPISNDPNFVVSLLASGLSAPTGGPVFRPPTGDLGVSEYGSGEVALVNAATGVTNSFASQTAPLWVAVRPSDGLVAVGTYPDGPIVFYNSSGAVQGSITATLGGCIIGLTFDSSGSFYVEDAPASDGNCNSGNPVWEIDEFPGPTPWTATSSTLVSGLYKVEGMVFSPTPGPAGSLYTVGIVTGYVYQVILGTATPTATVIATVPDANNTWPIDIAVDPLTGDIYVTRLIYDSTLDEGTDILKLPAGAQSFNSTPFATGFNDPYGLGFDSGGNLYVNDIGSGDLWKFARQTYTTPPQPVPSSSTGGTVTFSYNTVIPAQTITFPVGTNYGSPATASIAVDFQQWVPSVFYATRLPATAPNSWSGGTAVPAGTTCTVLNGTGGSCIVIQYLCYDSSNNPVFPCEISAPAENLIQLASQYTPSSLQPNPLLAIADDGQNDWANITNSFTTDTKLGGGTKGLNTDLFIGDLPPNITITAPAANATYTLNQAVAANYSCTDPQSQPAGYPTCTGTVADGSNIPTNSVGSNTFTVTSTDAAGTTGTASLTYSVVCHYVLIGFDPSSVSPGGISIVTGTLMSCASTAQKVAITFALQGPVQPNACSSTESLMFTTPPFTLKPNTHDRVSFPFFVPKKTCAGTYQVVATTHLNSARGTVLDTSSASLTVK